MKAERDAEALLTAATREEVIPLVARLLSEERQSSPQFVETCVAAIEGCGLTGSPALDAHLCEASAWWQHAAGLDAVARILELRGDHEGALGALERLLPLREPGFAENELRRARLLHRLGRTHAASAALRAALKGHFDYGFLVKAARLHGSLVRGGALPAARRIRVALISSTTSHLVAPLLRLACFRDGIDAATYEAPYGSYAQEILDPASGLYTFAPDFVVIATNWRDAGLPHLTDRPEIEIERVVSQCVQLWGRLLERHACRIVQQNFDLPVIDPDGHLATARSNGRSYMLRQINLDLAERAPDGVTILDVDQVSATFGKRAWFDASYWYLAKQYPSVEALPLLVDSQVAVIRAALGLSRKVLVLDLDNTLWGGVIGEDGLEGIRLGPPSATGEAHQALQSYALELKERGVLLAVCSKNNEADARLPFEKHDSSVLRLDDFVAFRANWNDKPTNLREIAAALNLGIDSLVFVDDNPVERALVRRELPEIAVPEIGTDPSQFVGILDRYRYFEALSISREDQERHQSYRANAMRAELQTTAASLDEFLRGLEMTMEAGRCDETVLQRVIQLLGKTNQFNLTARRHSEQAVRQMMTSPDWWTQWFRLRDRFGDNGLIGLMFAHRTATDATTWEIDTWLMSCRVIGRRVEEAMLGVLIQTALAAGGRTVRGLYCPTAKNGMVADLYERLGFDRHHVEVDGAVVHVLDLSARRVEVPSVVRLISAPTEPC